MTNPIGPLVMRVLVVTLAIAVLLCLVLAMPGDGGAGMHLALFCCVILATTVGLIALYQPKTRPFLDNAFGFAAPRTDGPVQRARAPDLIELGSLLI
jgi:hypothetical protein